MIKVELTEQQFLSLISKQKFVILFEETAGTETCEGFTNFRLSTSPNMHRGLKHQYEINVGGVDLHLRSDNPLKGRELARITANPFIC